MRKFQALAIALFVAPSLAHAGWVNATVTRKATVYRQANDASEALGTLREGKTVRIYTPERSGFYAVNFGKPIKGTNIGWISTGDVQLLEGSAEDALKSAADNTKRRSSGNRVKPSWLDFTFDLLMVSPGAFQTKIGEATKGISGTQFGLAYGRRFGGSSLGYQLGAFYYNVSGSGTLDTYSAKGFGATAGLDLQFLNSNQFSISGLVQVGMSINSSGNATSAIQFSTSNILAFPLSIGLNLRKYFGTFGFVAGGGYQIATLSQVPVVLQGPNDASGNPPQGVADFALSGIYGHLGISLNFD